LPIFFPPFPTFALFVKVSPAVAHLYEDRGTKHRKGQIDRQMNTLTKINETEDEKQTDEATCRITDMQTDGQTD
jgi:hypothetical protein